MNPAIHQLVELFENPYPVEWETQSDKAWIGSFRTEAGIPYRLRFQDIGIQYSWMLVFARMRGSREVYKVTGTGDQWRVFATVLEAINDLLNKQYIKQLTFAAKEKSRRGLYELIIKKALEPRGFFLDQTYNADGSKHYILKREWFDVIPGAVVA